MYPIAAAAIIGTVITVADKNFTAASEVDNIGAILGFLVMCFVGFFALRTIPQAVANITGQVNLASFAPQALRVVGKPLVKSAEFASPRLREFGSGFRHGMTSGLAERDRDRTYADLGRAARAKLAAFAKARD